MTKIKNKKLNSNIGTDRIIVFAGILLLTLTIAASVFSLFNNNRFINDPLSVVYYSRYVTIIVGGFLIGFLLQKSKKLKFKSVEPFFSGVSYSLLAFNVYMLFDTLRVTAQNLAGETSFIYGIHVFELMPVITVIAVLIFASFLRNREEDIAKNRKFIWTLLLVLVSSFVIGYAQLIFIRDIDFKMLLVPAIIAAPIFISTFIYFALVSIKPIMIRMLYSLSVGTLYYLLILLLWEFNTDPYVESVNKFGIFVKVTTISFAVILTGVLYLQSRKK